MNPVRRRTGSIGHAASLTIGDTGRPASEIQPPFCPGLAEGSAVSRTEEGRLITISPELHDQVQAKAESMNVTIDQMVGVLLKLGLAEQQRREAEIDALVERHRSGNDPVGRRCPRRGSVRIVKLAQWREIPSAVRNHLRDRMQDRRITTADLKQLQVRMIRKFQTEIGYKTRRACRWPLMLRLALAFPG